MKSILKLTLCVAMLGSLAACGVGVEDDNSYTAQNQKDAKALSDLYSTVVGTYTGTFATADKKVSGLAGTLRLYIVKVRQGTNPDGTVHVTPALYGRFQLDNYVTATDYVPMTGNYDKQGNIDLSTESAAGGTSDKAGTGGDQGTGAGIRVVAGLEIGGFVGNDTASIDLSRNRNGQWGHFEGTRVSTEVASPSEGEAQELADRLYALYSKMAGSYQGTIDNGATKARVEIVLSIAESTVGGGTTAVPNLIGQFRRLDFPTGVGERQLVVSYDSFSGAIQMTGVSTVPTSPGGGQPVPGSQTFSGRGTWLNQTLTVRLTDKSGDLGELKAARRPVRGPGPH